MTTALPTSRELVVDNFAGGGGASTGIEKATGRSPDVAAALVRANYQEQPVERVVYRGMPLMAGAEG